jgi:hypothetical protein
MPSAQRPRFIYLFFFFRLIVNILTVNMDRITNKSYPSPNRPTSPCPDSPQPPISSPPPRRQHLPLPFYSSPHLGASVVIHGLTKCINGHSDVVMGALILPPHSPVYEQLRFLQNAIGVVRSAYDSWLAQRGAKTLHLRMKVHGQNSLMVART